MTAAEIINTRQWTPTTFREKKDSGKIRLITDLRDLNRCHTVPKHRAETWSTLKNLLHEEEHAWGITLDLQSFFHHLRVHPSIQRWMRLRVAGKAYQIVALPFGWALSPWWANKLSKPIRKKLNQLGIPHAWYVDDVLILGKTPEETVERARQCVQIMTQCGIRVNASKSMMTPSQQVTYLGHVIDLQTSVISPTKEKMRLTPTLVRHQMKGTKFQPRALAGLAGHLLDAAKSNSRLHGLPAQLMKHAAKGVHFNKQIFGWNKHRCWNTTVQKPPSLSSLLRDIENAVKEPTPIVFRAQNPEKFLLQTDASDQGWGATLQTRGKEVATCAEPWTATEKNTHITTREALASAKAIQYLHHLLPNGCELQLHSDSTPTTWCWRKGSTVRALNQPISASLVKLHQKHIFVQADHLQGTKNKRADWLSRNVDPKNYALKPAYFREICQKLQVWPDVDLFANSRNAKCGKYASWRTDPRSLGNAWDLQWDKWTAWINPPWELIPRVLQKIKTDKARALICLPKWESQPWWRVLQPMMRGKQLLLKGRAIFQDPTGQNLPPPAWETLCTMVQG